MEYTTDCKVDQISGIRNELECVTKKWHEATEMAQKMEEVNKSLQDQITDLKAKVRFYEGQIVAYQYSLNCKR